MPKSRIKNAIEVSTVMAYASSASFVDVWIPGEYVNEKMALLPGRCCTFMLLR